MSAVFNYTLFISVLVAVLIAMYYFLTNKTKDIKVHPGVIVFGTIFLMALWLADLTALDMSINGMFSTSSLVPTANSKIPNLFVYGVCFIGMVLIHIFSRKLIKTNKNKKNLSLNKLLISTQMVGLILFGIFSVFLFAGGHTSQFLGMYVLGIYHSSLPLIIPTQIMLMLRLK